MSLRRCICFMLLVTIVIKGNTAPVTPQLDTIEVSEIKLLQNINQKTLFFSDEAPFIDLKKLPFIFTENASARRAKKVSPELVQKNVYLKFIVRNRGPKQESFYLFPGYFLENIELFTLNPATNAVVEIPDTTREPLSLGFKKLNIGPHEIKTIFAKIRFIKTTVNLLDPQLIKSDYLRPFTIEFQNEGKYRNAIAFMITGILLMMVFYSIAAFVLNGNLEFLYYSGYAFFMGVMFFLKSFLYREASTFNYFFESYFDFFLHCVGTFIYLAFLDKFVDARKNYPFLHKLLLVQQWITIISILLFTYLNSYTDLFILQDKLEIVTKLCWLVSIAIFILYALRVKNYLLNYLAIGHFCLFVCGLISLYLFSSEANIGNDLSSVLNDSLFYYELGLTLELIFFLIALAMKYKRDIVARTMEEERLKLISERQEMEKQLAVFSAKQEERNRISADMHDELGSGVTAIRLMSEIVKSKMKEQTLPEINRISFSANDLINKMNTIIWTMKSEHDTLESLITYIRTYALEFFENTNIDCTIHIPASFPNIELSGEKRRNIFLSVKESLNNVMKHSKASSVTIWFIVGEKLTITISDDGVGINFEKLRHFGNGLTNIKRRIESIEGSYQIENNEGAGARTTLELNL